VPDNLAVAYEEVFTTIDRLNSGRGKENLTDAASFRQDMRAAVAASENHARTAGYAPEDIRLATFAVIALLDACVLHMKHPLFQDWPKKPLGEEYFGTFNAGETFFISVQRVLQRDDSPQLADLLEVFQLCLLLGFQGRLGIESQGQLREVREKIADRIRRIRGTSELSPSWKPSDGAKRRIGDPLLKAFVWTAIITLCLAIALFIVYSLQLRSGASELAAMAGRA
jgi:type VI secretion system protein ImpK